MTGTYCQILGFGLMIPGTSEQSSSPTNLQHSALLREKLLQSCTRGALVAWLLLLCFSLSKTKLAGLRHTYKTLLSIIWQNTNFRSNIGWAIITGTASTDFCYSNLLLHLSSKQQAGVCVNHVCFYRILEFAHVSTFLISSYRWLLTWSS